MRLASSGLTMCMLVAQLCAQLRAQRLGQRHWCPPRRHFQPHWLVGKARSRAAMTAAISGLIL